MKPSSTPPETTPPVRKRRTAFFGLPALSPYIRPFRYPILLIFLINALSGFGDILTPLFQKYALDEFVAKHTLRTLPVFLAVCLAVTILLCGLHLLADIQSEKIRTGIVRDLRNHAFSHLQKLSVSYFNRNQVGSIHARVMSDISDIGELFAWVLPEIFWQILYFSGAFGVMFALNPRLSLWVLSVIPPSVILIAVCQKHLLSAHRRVRELNAQITSDFNESIAGAGSIKTLGVENALTRSFTEHTALSRRQSVRTAHIQGLISGIMELTSSVALSLILWKNGYMDASGIGTFSLFIAYAQGMIEPIRWIIDDIMLLLSTQPHMERFVDLMNTESDVTDTPAVIGKYGTTLAPKRENWEPLRGDIEFDDVSFRYPDGEETVLDHFSLKIPFGTHLAIVGETGAGKSTLANLVCRFFDPTEGRVLIDGRDARERSQLWLHSSIGYVLQSPHLFSGTIRDNLLYGNPQASEEDMWRALSLVAADEFVRNTPDGLDTEVNEGGDALSSGEKQLVSFARAILTDPKILILDEATASVDTLTEEKIQSAMETVIEGRTSFVIAHRLSTVRRADLILAVRNGKIVESGTHDQLMRANGYYRRLYVRQYEEEATASLLD